MKITFGRSTIRVRISLAEAGLVLDGGSLSLDVSPSDDLSSVVDLELGPTAWTGSRQRARITVEPEALREAASRHPCAEPVVEGTVGDRSWLVEIDTRSRRRPS